MPYITIPVAHQGYQMTFDDAVRNVDEAYIQGQLHDTHDTRTVYRSTVPERLLNGFRVEKMIRTVEQFNERNQAYIHASKGQLYQTFYLEKKGKGFSAIIRQVYAAFQKGTGRHYDGGVVYKAVHDMLHPLLSAHSCADHAELEAKTLSRCVGFLTSQGFRVDADMLRSFIKGGYRRIDAPVEDFKLVLSDLKRIFERDLSGSYHTAAFAYVKGRSTLDAIKRHQANGSRWFLKLDFSNFFGATTLDFVMGQLKLIFPFSEILKTERGYSAMEKCLSLCFLDGALPQGTPFSPTITNIMMIPIDHAIARMGQDYAHHLCYTRYADDILISSDMSFAWRLGEQNSVQDKILNILRQFGAPFSLNTEKTRYGSSAGRNWNLGVMLNKDNQITIGHEKKKVFKATLYSFLTACQKGEPWDLADVQVLNGQIAYYTMVEKEGIESIIRAYNERFHMDTMQLIKRILNGNM